ncbi:leucine--tRNA ligase [Isoptericola variabilis]|uniref:Leucine--tRNA ligase n=1 Tax=Isoptericola variabilis (strain 225) TaxID=743718 RepID=F6FV60_ISOV2|nr:leucine--tRNA ligase [Isoptericola variabilis]AEG45488.1 leucyl-tRNA synthetase [Isoptericola variabilis 225]TWH33824.1 leucyl-tRNA synthetase [Isoptericola variabilis J7]
MSTTTPRTPTPAPARTRAAHHELEARWQRVWAERGTFRARDDGARRRRYLLTMFPYPSGDLHMGHAEVFALEDVVARYWRLRGYDVMNPVGWDSFGLPAENAAIRRGENPAVYTEANIATQAATMRRYGVSFDWSRRLETHRPEYYRWTQWLFLRLLENDLAYRATAPVNWCPQDRTVLANEQVVGGRCERCGTAVVRRELTQWFVRITAYADRLLDDTRLLDGAWPARILAMQRNWIGRSAGARVRFDVVGGGSARSVEAFTTRPDTLPGAPFLAVAPESPVAAELCSPDRAEALAACRQAALDAGEIARTTADRAPVGTFLGAWVVHPTSGERLPVWAADHVLPGYGTGVVMGVPAHDERDARFAAAHGLPTGSGETWASVDDAVARLERSGRGERATSYRLRDWLVSRQRYWGAPVPVVHCPACGVVPVPDDELPVRLPELAGEDLLPRGRSPLASPAADAWRRVACPRCGGDAERDPDTLDTFVDSSWYFLRYCSPGADDVPFRREDARPWMPAARYVGGGEHAVLHLLYARFVTKVLHDLGWVDVVEPFASLLAQGQVVNRGRAMSKSLGNGVDLGEQLDRYGVDAVRLAMVFAGPPEDDVDWADVAPASLQRFLARALRLADDVAAAGGAAPAAADVAPGDAAPGTRAHALRRTTHRTVHDAEDLLERDRFNVVVARVMELVTAARTAIDAGPGPGEEAAAHAAAVREAVETVAVLLGLVAPYTAEEMWERLGHPPSVAEAAWPAVDPELLDEETVEAVVQVDGRVRDRVTVPADVDADALRAAALATPGVARATAGRDVVRVVVRLPRIVNVVTR